MNFALSMQRAGHSVSPTRLRNPVLMPNLEKFYPFGRRSTPRRAALPTNAAHPRSEAMDTACNSDSDSDFQSRLDLAHTTAVAASMLLNLAAAARENHGGRKRGSASQAPVSNLDGIAWQHPIKQDAPSTGSRPSGGKRARSATPAMPPHNKRLRTKTNFFEAGAAPAPSALRRQQAP